ncbi:hypothetical protein GEMRC1_008691 [Eukaryota sp. GEM-RC1]
MTATSQFWELDASYLGDICDQLGHCVVSSTTVDDDVELHLNGSIEDFLTSDPSPLRLQALLFPLDKCRIVELLLQLLQTDTLSSSLRLLCFKNLRSVIEVCTAADDQSNTSSSKLSFMLARSLLKADALNRLAILAGALPSESEFPSLSYLEQAAALETLSYAVCCHQITIQSVSSSTLFPAILSLLTSLQSIHSAAEVRKWTAIVVSVIASHRANDLLHEPATLPTLLNAIKFDWSHEVRAQSADALSLIVGGAPVCIRSLTQDHEVHLFIHERLEDERNETVILALLNLFEKFLVSTGIVTYFNDSEGSQLISANATFITSFIEHRCWKTLTVMLNKRINPAITSLAIRCLRLLVQLSPVNLRFGLTIVNHFEMISSLLTLGSATPTTPEVILCCVEASLCISWIAATDRHALKKLSSDLTPFSVWADSVGRALINSLLLLEPSSLNGMVLRDVSGQRLNGLGLGEMALNSSLVSPFVTLGTHGDLVKVRTMDLSERILTMIKEIPLDEDQSHLIGSVHDSEVSPSPYSDWDNKLTFSLLLLSLARSVAPKGIAASDMIKAAKQKKSLVGLLEERKEKKSPEPFKFGLGDGTKFGGKTNFEESSRLYSPLHSKSRVEYDLGDSLESSPMLNSSPKKSSPPKSVFKKVPFSPSGVVRKGCDGSYKFRYDELVLDNQTTFEESQLEFSIEKNDVCHSKMAEISKVQAKILSLLKRKSFSVLLILQLDRREL